MRINSSLVLLSKTKGKYWFSNYPHVWIVKTNYTFMSFLTAKFKLIIFWCQFCRVFCHFCQYLFTSNRQIELAHNLLIYRVKAEAERARGTIRTLSNDIWGFLEILEPRKPKQSLLRRINKKQWEIPTEPEGEERMRKIEFGGFTLCC